MATQDNTRKLFIGCLASYNEGIISGEWVDLADFRDLEDLNEKANAIVKASPCEGEEYHIQDYEGFGDLLKGAYPSISLAWTIHENCTKAEEEGIDADLFLEFLSNDGYGDLLEKDDFLVEKFQDKFRGSFDSLKEWAYEFVSDTLLCNLQGSIKEQIEYFFDYERYTKDCEYSGEIFIINLGRQVHVFSNY